MSQRQPAEIGDTIENIDTPALIVDLDAFEHNLDKMAAIAAAAGVRLRPHAKTHKSPTIAHMQIRRGAVGVCCQKVSEAEVMVLNGVADVLVSNQIVGARKLRRLAALARRARIGVCVDNAANVADLGAAATEAGVKLDVLIEVNVMQARCGVAPGSATAELAAVIGRTAGLHFRGLHAYHGKAQHYAGFAERAAAIAEAVEQIRDTLGLIRAQGQDCEIVTGSGTGTFEFEAASGVFNELQVGSYVFMDASYGRILDRGGAPIDVFEQSLFVLATIMSLPAENRMVCDAGLKALSVDSGLPLVVDNEGVEYLAASDEHGSLRLDRTNRSFSLGDKLRLIPGHCDPTVNLYDWFVCVRRGRVEEIWPISARGMLV
ncbi:MAG: DSD1 family PLP-dependent enzyme [Bosea sp.]|nr:DSD1 family PLP-dependent enzyme [Bosea sp. (in: a-proteobacteria)]MCO5089555.1 DSD1 family PLP-dependent enzyme [Bosea sp. (in: a-proteobacteria)]